MSALFPAAPDAFGADELLHLRRETPAWGSYAHFAHGSASLPPQVLYDALDSWLEAERRWGVQRAAEHFAEPLLAVRDSVARVLGTPVSYTHLDVYKRQGFSDASFYTWRAKFGGMTVADAKWLKDLELENSRLKKLLAEAHLDIESLKVVARGKG